MNRCGCEGDLERLESNISVATVTMISAPMPLKETRFPFRASEATSKLEAINQAGPI